jgi:hypothetical protein
MTPRRGGNNNAAVSVVSPTSSVGGMMPVMSES